MVWQSGPFWLVAVLTYTELHSSCGILQRFPFHSHSLSAALESAALQKYSNLSRWFHLVSEQGPIKSAADKLPVKKEEVWMPILSLLLVSIDFPSPLQSGRTKQADLGKFVELPGASKGNVVTRFPPEASG